MNMQPTFFVLGFQKAATSTLHQILKSSNQISLPINKETHFFSDENIMSRGYDWYEKQFHTDRKYKLKGEVDPSYIYFPNSIKNIKKIINNLKFILILRKPIDRAYSHYKMSFNRGYDKETFNKALSLEKKRLSDNNIFNIKNFSYMDRGNYFSQISKFEKVFSESKFLYLDFDDLLHIDSRKKMILSIYKFLEIHVDESLISLDFHFNKKKKIKYKFIQNILYKDNIVKKYFSNFFKNEILKNRLKNFILSLNTYDDVSTFNNLDYTKLSDEVINWNNKEVMKLECVLEKDLKKWIIQ